MIFTNCFSFLRENLAFLSHANGYTFGRSRSIQSLNLSIKRDNDLQRNGVNVLHFNLLFLLNLQREREMVFVSLTSSTDGHKSGNPI